MATGRSASASQEPPEAISAVRRSFSASGCRMNPITNGASGAPPRSSRKPTTPKPSITQTSDMRLLRAKAPMIEIASTVG